MKLAHVSDLHLCMKGAATDPMGVAEAIAADLIAISESLDLVVVSGDLTERAEHDAFAEFERMFKKIGVRVVVVPGNHDGPEGMNAYSRSSTVFADWNITSRIVEIAGIRVFGLDTCIEETTEGALDDGELDLLAKEVAQERESRLVVVMHHPPLVLGLKRFDGFCQLESRERFLDIVGAAREQVIVLSGHVHRPYAASEGRISCFVAGSMVAPYDSALPFGDLTIRPAALQDFYYIHDIAPGGRHVVTPQRVRGLAR